MDGIIAYILSKKYVDNSLIGIGAIKGAPCQVESIVKSGTTTTVTLKWVDDLDVEHTQSFDIEDGEDGVSVQSATIDADGHLKLTLSNGNILDCGKVLPQYDSMPTPSASNVGQILQYIGTTTSNYTNGYFYECQLVGSNYVWVQKDVQPNNGGGGDNIQVEVMPTASAEELNNIYQYIGVTDTDYTNGYFYKCNYVSGNYVWENINTQDSYTKTEIGNLNNLPDNTKNVVENISTIKLSVDQLSSSKLSISDIDDELSVISEDPVQNKVITTAINDLDNAKLSISDIDDALSSSSENPVQNKVINNALNDKVDKVAGKGLSENDYTTADKTKLTDLLGIKSAGTGLNFNSSTGELTATGAPITIDSALSTTSENPVQNKVITLTINQLQGSLADKVDKVAGKGLSENDYTNTDKTKLTGLLGIESVGTGLNFDVSTGELTATGAAITIDSALSTTSINPVQNKVITLALQDKVDDSSVGVAGGIAQLDVSGKVPSSQLPSYVDDIVDGYYNELDGKFYEEDTYTTEIVGESGKIYISLDTDIQYRWTGSAFAALGGALQLGVTHSTAYYGDLGKTAYDHSQIVNGTNPHRTTANNVNLSAGITVDGVNKTQTEEALSAINTLAAGNKTNIGTLSSLTTTHKDNLVNAINDVVSITDDKQPKTLSSPITVDGTSQTTVEGALGAINTLAAGNKTDISTINGLIPTTATTSNKLATMNDIPSAQVNSDWNASSGVAEILHKPTLGTAAAKDTTNTVTSGGTDVMTSGGVYTSLQNYYTKSEIDAMEQSFVSYGGAVTFANLPSLSAANVDKFYLVTDSFTTTSDFVVGAGVSIPANSHIAIINIGTASNPVYKYDDFGGLVDTSNLQDKLTAGKHITFSGTNNTTINAEMDDIADDFSTSTGYAVGDYCIYEGDLYRCTTAHTAGAWNSGHFTKVTVGSELKTKYGTLDTAETVLADGDYFPFYDTSVSAKRKTLWGNIKSVLKSYFDGLYTNNTGTVTSVATGVGLTGGTITGSGTIKASLTSETASALTSAAVTSTTNRQYAVNLDANSKLSVNVPWTDTYDEWTNEVTLSEGNTTASFTGLSTSYAYEVYFDCAYNVAPPTLTSLVFTSSSASTATATATFSAVTSAQAGTYGNSCKIKLRIVK